MTKMNWKRLLDFKCPRCSNLLGRSANFDKTRNYVCGKCHFGISEPDLERKVGEMSRGKPTMDDDRNLSDLNNLGMEPVALDFSDSPSLQ